MKWRFFLKKGTSFHNFWLEHLKERQFHLPGESRCVKARGWSGEVSLVWDPPQGLPHSREPKNAEWTDKKNSCDGSQRTGCALCPFPAHQQMPAWGQNGERMTTSTAVMLKGSPCALASSMCHNTGSRRWKRMVGKGMNARGKGVRKKNRTKMTGMPWATIMILE